MNNQKHFAAAISAFVIWGFFSIPLRALRDYSPGEILYYRILFSLLFLAAIILIFRRSALRADVAHFLGKPLQARVQIVALTLAGGVLLSINWLTFIYIVNHINVKTASFSYLICPVFTAVLGYFLINERMTRVQWTAVGLCAASCVLIGLNSALELGYSFLTALTYALYLISQRRNQGFDRIIVLGIQVAFSLLIFTALFSVLVETTPAQPYFFGVISVIALVFTVLPLFLNLYALNRINSATIGILMYINPIFNFSLAFLVFREEATLLQLMGYAIILAALVLFNHHHLKRLQWQ